MEKNQEKKILRKNNAGKKMLPSIRKEIGHLLMSEEAKISSRGILTGALSIIALGILADKAAASHWNTHDSLTPHVSYNPHYNAGVTHTNYGTPHVSSAPHVSSDPHASITALHTNTHASVNEAVTKGDAHNNATDGYGKHTASLSHNNNPNTPINTATHMNNPHYSYNAHASTLDPHLNVGRHASHGSHADMYPHHNAHNSHGSHYSHGQW